jgi:heme/copper-type cytochrome/quinol oxidase subunit 2
MKNNLFREVCISVVLVVLLFLCLNPLKIFMPTTLAMVILCVLVVLFCVFAVFVYKEKVQDEREEAHRSMAGRLAFLVGATILLIGIVVQDFQHQIDPWLVVALGAMIVTKVFGLWYGRVRF